MLRWKLAKHYAWEFLFNPRSEGIVLVLALGFLILMAILLEIGGQ